MSKSLNVLIVGVGGQGTLLASKFLGAAAFLMNKDVKVSEVHGMSQRGGSVVTCVKIGDEVASPIIDFGEADFLLSFEALESLRYLRFLKPDGHIVTNDQEINPMPVVSGAAQYPQDVISKIKASGINVTSLPALEIAEGLGNTKCVNMVLLGVLSTMIDTDGKDIWDEALKSVVPAKFLELNKKAFEQGRNLANNK